MPDRQSSSLSIKPLDHRGFAASGWFDLSTISKTRLTLTPANQYIGSLSKPRRRRRGERHQTKGLMRKTIAVHVRYKSLYIS